MNIIKTLAITAATTAAFFILPYLMDGPSDIEADRATAAAVEDGEKLHAALARHQSERPDLWTAETRARADEAALVVARGRP